MTSRKGLLSLAALAVLAALALGPPRFPSEPRLKADSPIVSAPNPAMGLTGTASCSRRACHGQLQPDVSSSELNPDVRLNEYSKWAANDKHAMAYFVLLEDRSKEIAGHEKPQEDSRCLACHTNPLAASNDVLAELKEERQSGVGCESCHGAAQKWLDPHTRTKVIQELGNKPIDDPLQLETHRQRLYALGMKAMGDPWQRAQVCAGCHVGPAPNRRHGEPLADVNHDLIARRHPRLNFEFWDYWARMPAHWDEKAKRPKQDPAKTWLVGQVVSARAALNLLQARAEEACQGHAPWPEFAEYHCYACHHDLQQPSWRQQRGYSGRAAGALPWGTWYWPLILPLSRFPNGPLQNKELERPFNNLMELMQYPNPNADRISKEAEELAGRLQIWGERVNGTSLNQRTVRDLPLFLGENGRDQAGKNWDAACQLYLALDALIEARFGFRPPTVAEKETIQAHLRRMFNELSLPPSSDSRTDRLLLRSKDDYEEDFCKELGHLLNALKPSAKE
jgi:hypothetical protein